MFGRRTTTSGLAVIAAATALAAAAGPAEAAMEQRSTRPQVRQNLGPIAIAVVTIGARVGARFGPGIVRAIRGGSRAAKRGRAAARGMTRWGKRYARRGRRAALAAWAAFRALPAWVQGCTLTTVKARAEGAGLPGMAIACVRGLLLVRAGKDPRDDPGAFLSKRRAGPVYA